MKFSFFLSFFSFFVFKKLVEVILPELHISQWSQWPFRESLVSNEFHKHFNYYPRFLSLFPRSSASSVKLPVKLSFTLLHIPLQKVTSEQVGAQCKLGECGVRVYSMLIWMFFTSRLLVIPGESRKYIIKYLEGIFCRPWQWTSQVLSPLWFLGSRVKVVSWDTVWRLLLESSVRGCVVYGYLLFCGINWFSKDADLYKSLCVEIYDDLMTK